MGWAERVAIIGIGAIIVYLSGSICYKRGRSDYAKEYNSVVTIDNWRSAFIRTKAMLEQERKEKEAWRENCHGVSNIDKVFNLNVIK